MRPPKPSLQTRREFLRTSLVGGALSWTVPSFLHATLQSLHAAQDGALIQRERGRDGRILVVIQLAGGNDGLNTVIPIGNDHYYRARPSLGIQPDDSLKINDAFGLHPGLAGLKQALDDGDLAIVHGVGYPNPNRSHFRSMEIWHTASDSDRNLGTGWLGRYFDNNCSGCSSTAGINIGDETPQAFASGAPIGITFRNPDYYRLATDSFSAGGLGPEDEMFREMNAIQALEEFSGSSIGSLSGRSGRDREEAPIDFLERTAMDAQVSSEKIRKIAASESRGTNYPNNALGRDLELIGKLIKGDMDTRVYYASHGGFDTHVNQTGTHQRLLSEFSTALRAFLDDIKQQGNLNRVTVLTFSEFGRRVSQNANNGTDHGAAAPVFVAGAGIRAGLAGDPPSLDPADLDRGDVRHTVDFRSVYATILEQHLGADSRAILGRAFPTLPLFG